MVILSIASTSTQHSLLGMNSVGLTRVIVDGTFGTPYNQQLLSIDGVDVVINSATKYLGGHSDLLAGTISSNDEQWMKECGKALKLFGGTLPAFDSYLLGRGLKTLSVRMARHNESAMKVAKWLSSHERISVVHYPGLPSHPDHELAKRQMIR
jgi:cystathionine beta-lyase/cystathionine gamma-synthase